MRDLFKNCLAKQDEVKKLFNLCLSADEKYKKIIELGQGQPSLAPEFKTPENIVKGCQSILYLRTYVENGHLYFQVESEALISSGLASLLTRVYSGETPETVLKCPPAFIDDLGLAASLTPGRSNGLASMYLRMKQEALKFLLSIK